jgi:hypothetical protein
MASKLTVPEIITIAKISGYLADNDVDTNGTLDWGTLDSLLPVKIYELRKSVEWAYGQNYAAAAATALFSIDGSNLTAGIFTNVFDPTFSTSLLGGKIVVKVTDPNLGVIQLGSYILNGSDVNNSIIATHVAAAITGYGYTAVSTNNFVTVTAPISLGSSINNNSLTVTYSFVQNSFDYTFDFTFQ